MPARRIKSLHHNLPDGKNVVYHREHRSKKGRNHRYVLEKRKFRKFRTEKSKIRLIEREITRIKSTKILILSDEN